MRPPQDWIRRRALPPTIPVDPGPLSGRRGCPLRRPSANTLRPAQLYLRPGVLEDMDGKVEGVVDGGPCSVGVESTILDMTCVPPMILRPGAVTKEMLEEVIGEVRMDQTLISENSSQAPKAPGMKYRHYAPKAQMILIEGKPSDTVLAIKQLAYDKAMFGKKRKWRRIPDRYYCYCGDDESVYIRNREKYRKAEKTVGQSRKICMEFSGSLTKKAWILSTVKVFSEKQSTPPL